MIDGRWKEKLPKVPLVSKSTEYLLRPDQNSHSNVKSCKMTEGPSKYGPNQEVFADVEESGGSGWTTS